MREAFAEIFPNAGNDAIDYFQENIKGIFEAAGKVTQSQLKAAGVKVDDDTRQAIEGELKGETQGRIMSLTTFMMKRGTQEAANKIANLSDEVKEHKTTIDFLRQEGSKDELDRLRNVLREKQKKIESLEERNRHLEEEVESIEARGVGVVDKSEVDAANQKAVHLETQVASLEGLVAGLQQELREAKANQGKGEGGPGGGGSDEAPGVAGGGVTGAVSLAPAPRDDFATVASGFSVYHIGGKDDGGLAEKLLLKSLQTHPRSKTLQERNSPKIALKWP